MNSILLTLDGTTYRFSLELMENAAGCIVIKGHKKIDGKLKNETYDLKTLESSDCIISVPMNNISAIITNVRL